MKGRGPARSRISVAGRSREPPRSTGQEGGKRGSRQRSWRGSSWARLCRLRGPPRRPRTEPCRTGPTELPGSGGTDTSLLRQRGPAAGEDGSSLPSAAPSRLASRSPPAPRGYMSPRREGREGRKGGKERREGREGRKGEGAAHPGGRAAAGAGGGDWPDRRPYSRAEPDLLSERSGSLTARRSRRCLRWRREGSSLPDPPLLPPALPLASPTLTDRPGLSSGGLCLSSSRGSGCGRDASHDKHLLQ